MIAADWKFDKSKHGIPAERFDVCYIENGTEDMALIVHSAIESPPYEIAALIQAAPDLRQSLRECFEFLTQINGRTRFGAHAKQVLQNARDALERCKP